MKVSEIIRKSGEALFFVFFCGLVIASCSLLLGTSSTPAAPEDSCYISGNLLSVDVTKVPSLADVGGSTKIHAHSDGKKISVIVIKSGENEYIAFSDKCSHDGKELEYIHDKEMLQCVSIGECQYNMEGKPIGGQADKGIHVYESKQERNRLNINIGL